MGVLVYVHVAQSGGSWESAARTLPRVPCVGEYVALSEAGPWYRVVTVAHGALARRCCQVEVFCAEPRDTRAVLAEAVEASRAAR